jgi:cell division protease FtsH
MARRMVTEWGMSKKLGPLHYGADQQEVFLGHSVTQSKNMSDATAEIVDSEVRVIVDRAYQRAETILTEHADQLERLAQALLEYETLSGDDIKIILDGGALVREEASTQKAHKKSTSKTSVPTSDGEPKKTRAPLKPKPA